MKNILFVAIAGAVALALSSGAHAQQQKVRINLASAFPTSLTLIGEGAPKLAKKVERISGGTLEVRVNEPGALVPALQAILIPPSIMLVIMGDLLAVSVGTLFASAVIPGLLLSLLYLVYICALSFWKPELAPSLPDDIGPKNTVDFWKMIGKSFFPPTFLISLVLGSIFGGWATPAEAAGVGSAGTLFYMKGTVPPSITMAHIYRGIVPFVILQLVGLIFVMAFPQLALWLPRKVGFLS